MARTLAAPATRRRFLRAASATLAAPAGCGGEARRVKVEVGGAPVHCEVRGAGRSALMLHGLGVDHRLMLGCMEPVFAGRPGWQRVYFDLPGMGRSPASELASSSDGMLEIALAVVDAVAPGRGFVAVGESYGGYLARGLLATHRERLEGLALICPAVVPERAARELPPKRVLARQGGLLASLDPADAAEFESVFAVQTGPHWGRFRDEILPALRAADRRALERLAGRYRFSFDVDALARPFEGPALVMVGRQDTAVGYRDALRLIEDYPRGSFAVLDGAGHNLQIEQAGLFGALVGEWFGRVEGRA